MELLDLLKQRSSVRKFTDEKVEQEKIDKIIEAGRVAPTACNLQPQKIIVIDDKDGLDKWKKCTYCHFNEQLVFIICYDKTECWVREFDGKTSGNIDCAIVATHMMLEATSLGIGSTWVMYFIPEAVRKEFALPQTWEDVAVLACGYPASDAPVSGSHFAKKDKSEIFFEHKDR